MAYPIKTLEYTIQHVLPTVYDDSLSYYELLNKVVEKVNEIIRESNEYFEQDLKSYVSKILLEWYDDGTLATIINDDVFEEMNDRIKSYGVDPKYFGAVGDSVTDDTEPVRQAIRYAEENELKVFLSGIYLISDEVEIKRPLLIEGVGSGSGYGNQSLTEYNHISGFLVKGDGRKRVRTRVLHRSSSTSPQDPPLSVALNIQSENVVFRNFTVFLDFDKQNNSPSHYGSNFDVGIFIGCRVHTFLENVHVLGYWREASIYHDVTRADNLSEFKDLDGNPYDFGSVRHGADGLTLIKSYTRGGKWGLKIQGAKPTDNAIGYSEGYYDQETGMVVTDRRGVFGSSDVTAIACSFYGTNHHTLYRRDDSTGNYLTDNGGGCLSIDGLAGNSSGVLQGMRFISCRFSSWEPFRIKLDRVNRIDFFGCHGEWGGSAYTTDGTPLTFSDSEVYGTISSTDSTTNLCLYSYNSFIRENFIGKNGYTALGGASDSTANHLQKDVTMENQLYVNGFIGLSKHLESRSGELDLRSLSMDHPIRLRQGSTTQFLIDRENTTLYGHVLPKWGGKTLGNQANPFRELHVTGGVFMNSPNNTVHYVRVKDDGTLYATPWFI